MRFLLLFTFLFSAHVFAAGGKQNAFNPDISLNTLLQYQNGLHGNDPSPTSPNYANGFTLDEAELILTSDVDTYAKLVSTLSIHKEGADWKLEPEELYAESLGLNSFTLKAGKFKAALGKANTLHKHALPFINQNLINVEIFDDEGLNSAGVSASYLAPLPWFAELTAQAITADNKFFVQSPLTLSPNAMAGVARLRNLFDLSDSLTLDVGLSGALGPNDVEKTSIVGGGDLTFKWRPTQGGKYSALIWSTEYLNGSRRGNPSFSQQPLDICTQGGATYLQWQFAERWWIQGRAEYLDQKIGSNYSVKKRASALIGFVPTEFSAFRLQYDNTIDPQWDKPDHKILLQANFSIGAHPAHAY